MERADELTFQDVVEPAPKEPSLEDYKPPDVTEADELEKAHYDSGTVVATYYREKLIELHGYEEKRLELIKEVLKAKELPWDICKQGKLKDLANDKMPCRAKLVEACIQEIALEAVQENIDIWLRNSFVLSKEAMFFLGQLQR